MDHPVAVLPPTSARPRGRTLVAAWVLTALAASLVIWLADVAFYDRFGLVGSDLPSWTPWSTLELSVQALAWFAVAALWLWWPRRKVVVTTIVIVVAVVGLAARAWAHHEADRAWAGTSVWPRAVLPFSFTARTIGLVPYGTRELPEGIPSTVLLLRHHPDSVVVYDPATHRTMWVGNKVAVPVWTGASQ